MPKVHNVCNLPEFSALVQAGRDHTITAENFALCLDGFQESLRSAYERTRARLRTRVSVAADPFFDPELASTPQFDDLELATIVFRCDKCQFGVFGWDDVRSHCCSDEHEYLGLRLEYYFFSMSSVRDDLAHWNAEFPYTFEYWEAGSVAVRRVISSLGMDPTTTTTAQLDAEPDLRLECGCHSQGGRAFKWRTLVWLWILLLSSTWLTFGPCLQVNHLTGTPFHQIHPDRHPKGRVPVACLPNILEQECHRLRKGPRDFACAHCTLHLKAGQRTHASAVKEHLSDKSVHMTHF